MKECTRLKDYTMGSMSPNERKMFEVHLAECKACQHSLAADSLLADALSGMPKVNVPAGFCAAVMEQARMQRQSRIAWIIYGAAVIMIAAITGLLLGGNLGAAAGESAVIARAVGDFGVSMYTAIYNISAVLYRMMSMGRLTPVLLTAIFMGLCFVFYKTVALMPTERK